MCRQAVETETGTPATDEGASRRGRHRARIANGSKVSDMELLKRLRETDADAAEALVNTYGARAYRLAVRITGNEADAEEVVQDALWTVVRRVEMFRGDAALWTWIYRITANAAYEQLRRRGRRQREISWDDLPPTFDDEERRLQPVDDRSQKGGDPAVQIELRTVLTAAIDELRAVDRTVFVLHDVDGMSNPDIAATLDLTVPAVKSRVHRARLLLRRRLRDYLEDISTGTWWRSSDRRSYPILLRHLPPASTGGNSVGTAVRI